MARPLKSYGLTLVEMAIVVLVLGLLATAAASQLNGIMSANAKAVALYDTTQKMALTWNQITTTCGTNSSVINSPLLASSSNTVEDVLTKGNTAINSTFQSCYLRSNVQEMNDIIQSPGSSPQILGYSFRLTCGGMNPFIAIYNAVPADVTYQLAARYGGLKAASLPSQDTTNPHIQYQPDGQGTYQVQILIGAQTLLATGPVIIGTTPVSGSTGTTTTTSGTTGQGSTSGSATSGSSTSGSTTSGSTTLGGTTSSPCPATSGISSSAGGSGSLSASSGGCASGGGAISSGTGSASGSQSSSGIGSSSTSSNGNTSTSTNSSATNTSSTTGNGTTSGSASGGSIAFTSNGGTSLCVSGSGSTTQTNIGSGQTSTQMPINIGGNQQVSQVNNQCLQQSNQSSIGNVSTGTGSAGNNSSTQQTTGTTTTIIQ